MRRHRLGLTAGLLALLCGTLCIPPAYGLYAHTATLQTDRNILVVGGIPSFGGNPTTAVNLIVDGVSMGKHALTVARSSHTATLLPNGEILVAGGWCTGGGTCVGNVAASVEVYNPVYNCWHAPLGGITGRYDHTATLLRAGTNNSALIGSVLLCGGYNNAGTILSSCDLYTPTNATASDSSNQTCSNVPGTIDVWGGAAPSLQQGRANHTATMLPDGRVFFAGGQTAAAAPNDYTTTTEIFAPNSLTFLSAYPLSQGRAFHQATLSGDGKVIITGGYNAQNVVDDGDMPEERFASQSFGWLRTTEIYDPVADHMSIGGTMPERRAMHTTSLNGAGALVMLGGIGNFPNSNRGATSDSIVNGVTALDCSPEPISSCTVLGLNMVTQPDPYQLSSSYWTNSIDFSKITGNIIQGAEYYTVDPITPAPPVPSIVFPGGSIAFAPASPLAGTGPKADMSGTQVFCKNTGSLQCGYISRQLTVTGINVGNGGTNQASFASPMALNIISATLTGGNFSWAPPFPSPGTSGDTSNLTASNIDMQITVTGLPPQLIGSTITAISAIISKAEVKYYVGGDLMYDITVASTIALGSQGHPTFTTGLGLVTPTGDPITGEATFQVAVVPITPDAGENIITLSSGASNPPPSPLAAAGMTWSAGAVMTIYNDATNGYNLGAGQISLNPVPEESALKWATSYAVSITTSFIFSGVAQYAPKQPAANDWNYTWSGWGNARYGQTTTLLPTGELYEVGGMDCNPLDVNIACPIITRTDMAPVGYVAADAFTVASGAMMSARGNHTATLLPNGTILVAGGTNGPNILGTSEIFNPATQSFTPTPGTMRDVRDLHTATLLANGRVLVAGGLSTNATSTGAISSSEVFYPDTGYWLSYSTMTTARSNHTATLLPDGNVLALGGFAQGQYLNSAEVYYSTAQAWIPFPAMHTARGLHTTTLLQDGRILVVGGENAQGVLDTYEIYSPQTNTWTAPANITDLTQPAYGNISVRMHSATLLIDGRVLVAGGNNGQWEQDSYLIFDPKNAANPWSYSPPFSWNNVTQVATVSMWAARQSQTATLLPNGQVMVIGGAQSAAHGGNSLSAVENFDPFGNSWAAWGTNSGFGEAGAYVDIYGLRHVPAELTSPRAYHTATLTPDGNVWAIGGFDGLSFLKTAESHYYAPGTPDVWSVNQPSSRLPRTTSLDHTPFKRGDYLTVTGQNFLDVTEASGGGSASGNSDQRHPIWILQSVEGSGGGSSQGNSGFILDLTTSVYQDSCVGAGCTSVPPTGNAWSNIDSSMTVQLPASLGASPQVGAPGYRLPYGWYNLRAGANDQLSPSYLVQAGPALPTAPVQNLTVYPGPANIPPAPLFPGSLGTSSMTFTWNTPAGMCPPCGPSAGANCATCVGSHFDGYNIYAATTGVFISSRADIQVGGGLGYNSFTLPGPLPPSTTQAIWVKPFNISGDIAGLSTSATAYTLPWIPLNVAIATAPNNTFFIQWSTAYPNGSSVNGQGTLYEVSESLDGFNTVLTTFTLTTGNSAPTTALSLTPNVGYWFRVRACNLAPSANSVCSPFAPYLSTTTLTGVYNVQGVAFATDTINWSWPAAGGGASYNIYNATIAAITPIITVATNSWSQTGLTQNTRMVIQVQATIGGSVGPLSAAATAYSLAYPPVFTAGSCPSSPGVGITTGSMVAYWNTRIGGPASGGPGPEGNPVSYDVEYATGNWNRATGAWSPGITPTTLTIPDSDPTVITESVGPNNINPGVPVYIRVRSINTAGNFMDPTVNPNYSYTNEWVDLVSSSDPTGFVSTLPMPTTTLMVISPESPTSATLWWFDPNNIYWQPPTSNVGYTSTNFQVLQTTCVINGQPDFYHSSGPACGIVPPSLGYGNLPFNSNSGLITNLNTWATYYFMVTEENLPHWEGNRGGIQEILPAPGTLGPIASYYPTVPGATPGTLTIEVTPQTGGSISSAPVGVPLPGPQHVVWFNAPPESFPSATLITIATFSVLNDPRLAACPGAGGPGATLCGGDNNLAFEITANPPLQPTLPLYFTVAYNSGEPNIPGDSTTPDPLNAVLMRFDLTSCKCVPVLNPNTPNSNTITGELNHLSIYQVATAQAPSTPEDMRIYPNPYYTSRDGWLTIDQVPAGSRIRLFTLRGEMVLDSSADSHGIFTWQGANRGGRAVASGVYLVVVEGNGIKAIRKLAMIR
jgi:hypothetical protein